MMHNDNRSSASPANVRLKPTSSDSAADPQTDPHMAKPEARHGRHVLASTTAYVRSLELHVAKLTAALAKINTENDRLRASVRRLQLAVGRAITATVTEPPLPDEAEPSRGDMSVWNPEEFNGK
jgi:hypothetical protein